METQRMRPPSLIFHLSSSQLGAIAFWFRLRWLGLADQIEVLSVEITFPRLGLPWILKMFHEFPHNRTEGLDHRSNYVDSRDANHCITTRCKDFFASFNRSNDVAKRMIFELDFEL